MSSVTPLLKRKSTSLSDLTEFLGSADNLPLNGRKTKIICTIGPVTKSVEMLCEMLKAGMNVSRLNFSHGTQEYHRETIENIRKASEKTKIPCAILLDTKGPEIRTGMLKNGKPIELLRGSIIDIHCAPDKDFLGDTKKISVDHAGMVNVVNEGTIIKIDDGLILIKVLSINGSIIKGEVLNNQELGEKKGVNIPGVDTGLPALTEKDESDIRFGLSQRVDIIAPSFINSEKDVIKIRKILGKEGAYIKILSKIESVNGINNFDKILEVSDGIMIARGDLGVEIPIEKVNMAQKTMISKCNSIGKPIVTATQMLDSMIKNPTPTRAEATDVANAVFDGTDCVMLSGESAKGSYPIEAVSIMSKICIRSESSINYHLAFKRSLEASEKSNVNDDFRTESVTAAAVQLSMDLKTSLIFALSDTGRTSNYVSKHQSLVPVLCVTPNEVTSRQSLIRKCLWPILVENELSDDERFKKAKKIALKNNWCEIGDDVVIISGKTGVTGSSHKLKVVVV